MKINNYEKGQTIVIIALSLIGLVAMAALIIDGSNAYLNRRKAQTAADAAALAGAREWCMNSDWSISSVEEAVEEFATIQNHATDYELAWDEPDIGQLTVTTWITKPTFFAKVFNKPTSTVQAVAAAGCFNPAGGKGVLPIGWMCVNIDDDLEWQSPDCKFKAIDYRTELVPLHSQEISEVWVNGLPYSTPYNFDESTDYSNMLKEIYIIMDTTSLADIDSDKCYPEGEMICDLDGDEKYDFLGFGDVGWLDLDGTTDLCSGNRGADAVVDWITEGFPCDINEHTWVPSQEGNIINALDKLAKHLKDATIEDHVFVLPIFNQYCVGDPFEQPPEACRDLAHINFPLPPDMAFDDIYQGNIQADTYYHIVGFGFFYVSCVDSNPHGPCPGHQYAVDKGVISNNVATVEGFFVTGVPIDFDVSGPGGVDVGAYVLSLTQ